jgi:hypothetical protein
MAVWPPTLDDLKADLGINDSRDDVAMSLRLSAAIDFVLEQRTDIKYDTSDPLDLRPLVNDTVFLGTIRLAARWYTQRRSDADTIPTAEFGTYQVAAVDQDIQRQLKIGRFAGFRFA